MTDANRETDREAIRALISRQFASLSWGTERPPRWQEFAADFLSGASLFPAARPLKATSVPDFVERMRSLAASTMPRFEEALLHADIRLYGNVAVALVACEQIEDEASPQRAVEAILLVKDEGKWQIAAQAWDRERDDAPVPESLSS